MSARRLVTTAGVMALVGVLLATLTPPVPVMTAALASAQRTADTAGPDTLVICTAGLLAWAIWAWGTLGLALTAATAVPGLLGRTAHLALHVLLPAGARRSAALALGLTLGVAAPLMGTAATFVTTPAAAAVSSPVAVPDWPTPTPTAPAVPGGPAVPTTPALPGGPAVPDWPSSTGESASAPDRPAGSHVVLRGDCLWHIAADRLLEHLRRAPTGAEIAQEVHAWWTTNADVIGPDPDLLLPGQVLRPPPRP